MNRNYNYNNYGGGAYQQNQGMQPWMQNANPTDQLSSMDMELEMMKKKRLMLQEQRQLLQEQRQLQRLQQNERPANWDQGTRFPNARNQSYNTNNYASMYQPQKSRRKRPAAGPAFGRPSKRATIEQEVDEDVGPVEPLPYPPYPGPDKATPSMRGRVEFALGIIVREVRGNDTLSAPQLKELKERVRQRLHSLLLNQPLGTANDIVGLYRIKHTQRSDRRVLEGVLKSSGPLPFKEETEAFAARSRKQREPRKPASSKSANSKPPISNEKAEIAKTVKVYIHKLLEDRMDILFDKLHAIASEDATTKENTSVLTDEKSEPTEAVVKEEPAADAGPEVEKPEEKKPEEVKIEEVKPEEEKTEEKKTEEKGDDEQAEAAAEPEDASQADEPLSVSDRIKFIVTVINRILVHKMPAMMHRYKRHMISILARDEAFKKLGLTAPLELPELPKTQVYKQIFYLKIVGKPSLPQRHLMQNFLEQFKCISVKKHKTIFNLLFVGVSNEDDYRKMLDSDGHVIDGKTLEIRKSDHQKDIKKKDEELTATDYVEAAENGNTEANDQAEADNTEQEGENKKGNEPAGDKDVDNKIGDSITSLDTEINDLLTCINDEQNDSQIDAAGKEGNATVVIEDDDDKTESATGICTRRSSRLPK